MSKSTKIIISLMVILLTGLGIILKINSRQSGNARPLIVATNFPAYDFARAVAGDTAEIKMLIDPGVETHDFEPTPGDIIDIKNSQMFIYNGGESDEWVDDILKNIGPETKILRMMDAVSVVEEETVEGMETNQEQNETKHRRYEINHSQNETNQKQDEVEYDEHIWTSVRNAQKIINYIKNELIRILPEHEKLFNNNAQNYAEKLADLDVKFQEIVNNGKRKTLIFGDRFPLRYFVDDYNLNYFAAFPGCSEQTEASGETIAFLAEKIQSEKIPVVLKIELSSGAIAETIARETGAKILTFQTGHNLSATDFTSGRTYVEIMTENLATLKEALE